jgi:hypothetical protein
MTISINSMYWNSILSGAAYALNKSDDELERVLKSQELAKQFNGKYEILNISTDSAPTDTGFAAMVVKDKITGKVTIAFRGTERSLSDYASDALAITSGVAAGQIVDMYNYLLRVFAPEGAVVDQYVYDVGTGALRGEELTCFLRCLREKTPVPISGADGLAVLEVIDRIFACGA